PTSRAEGWPKFLPCSRALRMPALVRARISERSNSLMLPRIVTSNLPAGGTPVFMGFRSNRFRTIYRADKTLVRKQMSQVARYRRAAEECRLNAERAMRPIDREAWFRLAADWAKLAECAELNRRLGRQLAMRAPSPRRDGGRRAAGAG